MGGPAHSDLPSPAPHLPPFPPSPPVNDADLPRAPLAEDPYLSDSSDEDESSAAGRHLLSLLRSSALASSIDADLSLFSSDPAVRSALNDDAYDGAGGSGGSGAGTTLARIEDEFRAAESECVRAYEGAASDLRDLSAEVSGCLDLLSSSEETLLGLQADLSSVGADALGRLREESGRMGAELARRRRAERLLREYLRHVVVSPAAAGSILDGQVPATDARFVGAVEEVERRHRFLCARTAGEADAASGGDVAERLGLVPGHTAAGAEMRTHVTRLRLHAAARVRAYFLHDAIPKIRCARTNIRMVQVSALLRYRNLLDFVHDVSPEVYEEIRDVYVESMARALHVLFRTYGGQLSRLDGKVGGRYFGLIAVEEAALRSAVQGKDKERRYDAFNLGERGKVLDLIGAPPILVHVALAEGEKYPYEMIFRSIMKHLMDSATNEYKFTNDFLGDSGRDAFSGIFSRTLSLVLEQLETYLFTCYDALGLLLMIKLNHGHRRIMHSRQVHVLDTFFDRVTMLLWPRLKMLLDSQVRAIRAAGAEKLGGVELHPHYVSRRYAEFTSSVLLILYRVGGVGAMMNAGPTQNIADRTPTTPHSGNGIFGIGGNSRGSASKYVGSLSGSPGNSLNGDTTSEISRGPGDMLLNDLAVIHEEIIALLKRLAGEHPVRKHGIVFLINNCDQIAQVLEERRTIGKELQAFEDMLLQQRELFVEEELLSHSHLANMIAFVRGAERQVANAPRGGTGGPPPFDAHTVESLVRDFATSWKKTIEQINKNVLSYFSNFRNGMEILKQVLTQLLLYYTRFQDVIRKGWRKLPSFCNDLVSTTVILAEIKKYALAI